MTMQRTVAAPITFQGVGIHSGSVCRVDVHPAEADTGRQFAIGSARIPARADFVVDTRRCTTLGHGTARVHTVEHLLSAMWGCGIDNAWISVDGPEIPILDGSALPFVEAIQSVGVMEQARAVRRFVTKGIVQLGEGASQILVEPASEFEVALRVEFDGWPEGRAELAYRETQEASSIDYQRDIAPARTFAFRREVEQLLAAGLARGGSLDNALIITPPSDFSTPLRVASEWAAHKLLDLLGDFALLDARPRMRVTAVRPGHQINTMTARALLQSGVQEQKEIE